MISVSYAVMTLGQCISPTAIFRGISKATINAVECGTGRSLAHVCKKVLKFLPSFANSDAFGSIGIKLSVFGIPASSKHGSPSNPRWRFAHAVCRYSKSMLFSSVASAGSCWALGLKSITANFCYISTFTFAYPSQVFAWCGCALDYQKASEALTRKIVWRDHSQTIMIFGE